MDDYPGAKEFVAQMRERFAADYWLKEDGRPSVTELLQSENHFLFIKDKLETFCNSSSNTDKIIKDLLIATVLTPSYPMEKIKILQENLVLRVIERLTQLPASSSEYLFHALVQFLLPQDSKLSSQLMEAVNNCVRLKLMNINSSYILKLKGFWDNVNAIASKSTVINNELTDNENKDIEQIFQIIRQYRDTRKKNNALIPLPAFVFFPIITLISTVLSKINFKGVHQLLTLLAIEPLFAYPMVEKKPPPISFQILPPLSLVYQTQKQVTHSFVSMYRTVLIPFFNLFGVFSKVENPESSEFNFTKICIDFIDTILLGAAGRDAFTLSLLSLYRTDSQKYIIERFYRYLSSNTIHSKEHDICSAGFIFAFDGVPSASTIALLNLNQCRGIIANIIYRIQNRYKDSPFKEKANMVYNYIVGKDQHISNVDSAISLIHLINQFPRPDINPNNHQNDLRIMEVILALSKKLYDPNYYSCFCVMIQQYLSNEKNSKFSLYFILNIASKLAAMVNHLPSWHYLSLLRENAVLKIIDNLITKEELILFIKESKVTLNYFFGAVFLLSRFLHGEKQFQQSTSISSYGDTFLLSFIMRKMVYSELPQMYRILIELTNSYIYDTNFEILFQEILFNINTNYRVFFRTLTALLQMEKFFKFISEDINIALHLFKLLFQFGSLTTQNNDNLLISQTYTFIWTWRMIGASSLMRNQELLNEIMKLMKLSTESPHKEYFSESLFTVLKNDVSSQSFYDKLEFSEKNNSFTNNNTSQRFKPFQADPTILIKDRIIIKKDQPFPIQQILPELTGQFQIFEY